MASGPVGARYLVRVRIGARVRARVRVRVRVRARARVRVRVRVGPSERGTMAQRYVLFVPGRVMEVCASAGGSGSRIAGSESPWLAGYHPDDLSGRRASGGALASRGNGIELWG